MKYKTNSGDYCGVVDTVSGGKVIVEFDGYEGQYVEVYKDNLKAGKVKNPFKPSVCGVGIVGVGLYDSKTTLNGVNIYRTWVRMIQRCYFDKVQKLNKTYVGCKVSDDFLVYQNFAEC